MRGRGAESGQAPLDLFGGQGVKNLDCRQDGVVLGGGPRESWLFNSTLAGIEAADAVLFIGTNPRLEAPVLNARFRKMWLTGKTRFAYIGEAVDLTYRHDHLGVGCEGGAEAEPEVERHADHQRHVGAAEAGSARPRETELVIGR